MHQFHNFFVKLILDENEFDIPENVNRRLHIEPLFFYPLWIEQTSPKCCTVARNSFFYFPPTYLYFKHLAFCTNLEFFRNSLILKPFT